MRGFTGHEHFDDVDRVHMNGRRVYDPLLEAVACIFTTLDVNGAITLGHAVHLCQEASRILLG